MANENCGTCGGEGVLTFDVVRYGCEHDTEERPCPDCANDDFDDRDLEDRRDVFAEYVESQLEQGGEA